MASTRRWRVVALTAAFAVVIAELLLAARPWYLTWGATADEVVHALAGDEIIPGASGQVTHAITIHAGIERVWPWVAQLGQDRGGFYSFDLLENLAGCRMTTVDELRPDKQTWTIGDRLWMYPPERAGGVGFATLRTLVPGRALGFSTHGPMPGAPEDGSWSFIVEPIDRTSTRFLVRGRGGQGVSLLGITFMRGVFEPAHFVMERRMMLGIKELAETGSRARLANHALVATFFAAFVLIIAAAIRVLSQPNLRRSLTGFFVSTAVFQVLTLGQPHPAIAVLLVGVTVLVIWPPARRARIALTSEMSALSAGVSRSRQ